MENDNQKTTLPPIETLRHAFNRCCKVLGLSQETCFALTLLLDSQEALMTMLWAMQEIEDSGVIPKVKDMTTLIVNIAVQIKDKDVAKKRN